MRAVSNLVKPPTVSSVSTKPNLAGSSLGGITGNAANTTSEIAVVHDSTLRQRR
jgi:hypothetical protein